MPLRSRSPRHRRSAGPSRRSLRLLYYFSRYPRFAAAFRQRPYTPDKACPLRHADDPARIQQIEQVARLDTVIVGGQRQSAAQLCPALLFGVREVPRQHRGVGVFEIVRAVFTFGAQEYITVAYALTIRRAVEV